MVLTFNTLFAITDTVSYGPTYVNDVYYSMKTGTVKTVVRDNWDIALSTFKMSSSILINDAAGVELYTYPNGDTSAWNTVDTVGFASWKMMYNSEGTWEDGAFSNYATGHPDYGWGVYNNFTHNIQGDSLFIIRTKSGVFYKLWMVQKLSAMAEYTLKLAPLGSTNDTTLVIDCLPYSNKNYYYVDLDTKSGVDREPDQDSWDFEFTKYAAKQNQGGYYNVTGVKQNNKVLIARVDQIDTSITNWSDYAYTDSMTNIGWTWKSFSMVSFTYEVDDSLVFFVKTRDMDVYKLKFTDFIGSSTGDVVLDKKLLSNTGIQQNLKNKNALVFPNPTSNFIQISIPDDMNSYQVRIMDISGKVVGEISDYRSGDRINVRDYQSGMYWIIATSESQVLQAKIIIQ